jgi:transcription initiation factor IIE alpha subunit
MTKSKKITNLFRPIKALKKKTKNNISKKGKLIN